MGVKKKNSRPWHLYLFFAIFLVSLLLKGFFTGKQARTILSWTIEIAARTMKLLSLNLSILRKWWKKQPYFGKAMRFYRKPPPQTILWLKQFYEMGQQTKGRLLTVTMGLLDDLLLELTGKTFSQISHPARKYWERTQPYRDPIRDNVVHLYHTVPRADLWLTAIGTTTSILVLRRAFRRFRTAQEIPLDYFRDQKRLKGYIINVNDSDNVRFYHSSPLSSLLRWRPSLKRSEIKFETINVRLAGIDAPEMAHFGGASQPYAKEAKAWLTKYADGRRATIQLLRYDQYGRAVAAVHVGWFPFRGNISVEMVKAGFATIYEDGGAVYGSFEAEIRKRLKEAQSKKKGMWKQSAATYISPSQYKKNLRAVEGSQQSAPSVPTKRSLRWAFWR